MDLKTREKFIKVTIWIIVIALVTTIFATWGMHYSETQKHDPIAIVADGIEITKAEYYNAYNRRIEDLRKQYDQDLSDSIILQTREEVADELIQRALINKIAKDFNIKPTDFEIDNAVKRRYFVNDKGEFNAQMFEHYKRTQPTQWWQQLENTVIDEIILSKAEFLIRSVAKISDEELKNYYAAVKMEIKMQQLFIDAAKFISDATAEKYYNDNRDTFVKPEKRNISRIIISDTADIKADTAGRNSRVAINNIFDKLKGGANFEDLANKFSDAPFSFINGKTLGGGNLGFVTIKDLKEMDDMPEIFIEKAFSMKKYEISEPFRTARGWEIIKINDIADTEYYSFSEKKDDIKKQLLSDSEYNKAMEIAKNIYAELSKNPDAFENLIKTQSDAPSKNNKGILPFLGRTQISDDYLETDSETKKLKKEIPVKTGYYNYFIARDFADTIFNLPVNVISSPIKSKLGAHIIKPLEFKIPDNSKFNEDYSEIYRSLMSIKSKYIINDWYKNYKTKVKIKYKLGDNFFKVVDKATEE